MEMKRGWLVFAMLMMVEGCVSYSPGFYRTSADNLSRLKNWEGRKISVGQFTDGGRDKASFMCRDVGLIQAPDESTFASYIQDALVKELKEAGLYSESSDLVVTGVVNHLDYQSDAEDWGASLNSGIWEISLTLVSSRGGSMTVNEEYKFNTNWNTKAACDKSAQAFMPAVQHLIYKIVSSKEFAGLLK